MGTNVLIIFDVNNKRRDAQGYECLKTENLGQFSHLVYNSLQVCMSVRVCMYLCAHMCASLSTYTCMSYHACVRVRLIHKVVSIRAFASQ